MQIYYEAEQICMFDQDICAGRMSPALSPRQRAKTSGPSWRKLSELKYQAYMSLDLTPGVGNLLGESYWEILSPWRGDALMLNTGVSPREEKESSLSQILEPSPLRKYYLTQTACLGILRRARERGKELPPQLKAALEIQAGVTPPDRTVGMGAYHMNQRDEGIDLGDASGAPTAFAASQRDEVRDLHDIAGALGAQPDGVPARAQRSGSRGERSRSGMNELSPLGGSEQNGACGDAKQQTFVAERCLTPWDTQQERIFTPESKAPTLAGADGGGRRNPAGLVFAAGFSAGQGAAAGGIGYQEEIAPTLKAAESGTNMVPSILCLNDQGGQRMDLSVDITGTLRADEKGHQPLVYENHGIDSRYTGPHDVAPTMSARYGTGGNNVPLVSQDADTFCIAGNIIDRQVKNGGNGLGCQPDISYTLTGMDHLSGCPDKRSNPEG